MLFYGPCRRVQETQERINALQEVLKREVAAAEAIRIESAVAIRRQNALKAVRGCLLFL